MTETTERTQLTNHDPVPGTRFEAAPNKFGFTGIDHVALPANDVTRMAHFLTEVLGGEVYYAAGFDEQDRTELHRQEHVFMHVGSTLIQFASPNDGIQKVGKDDHNSWPHWALGVTPEGLKENVDRLRALGVPVWGPVEHRGAEAVSAYFTSPEGHKFELVTWDLRAAEYSIGVAGSLEVGHIDWEPLFHSWPDARP